MATKTLGQIGADRFRRPAGLIRLSETTQIANEVLQRRRDRALDPLPSTEAQPLARQALRAGGHIIVVRHGATHADQADTDPLNLDNVAKQRQLNDKGRADARAFGDVLKQSGVPIGKVSSSRFQRAVETA